MILTNVVKLYPNAKTRKRLDFYILMRDKYWNISLSKWNDMYDTHSIECHLVKTMFTPQIDKKGNLKHIKKGKAVVKEKNYYSNAVIKDLSLTEKQRKVQNIVTNIFLNNMKCC